MQLDADLDEPMLVGKKFNLTSSPEVFVW